MFDDSLVQAILGGDRTALARAITLVESGGPQAADLLQALHQHTGTAYRVGVTGPPGSGKSTLINQLIGHFRSHDKSVAVLAIDPSSSLTQGALLGDRVRMKNAELDSDVFVRSMASRGALGGLSYGTHDVANLFDAAGFDYILIESLGVGQSESGIAAAVDTVMVVLVPDSGDSIQAMKAGLMEIADVFVLNKCDRSGSDQFLAAIQSVLKLPTRTSDAWLPGVVKVSATQGQGIDEIVEQILRHRDFLNESGGWQQRQQKRLELHIKEIVEKTMCSELWQGIGTKRLKHSIYQVANGTLSPYELAQSIVDEYLGQSRPGR